jgi:hypothetical protein
MFNANRPLADQVVERRIGESAGDYLAYCIMCRDRLARQGKRAVHLLDLLCGEEYESAALRPAPGYSERQANRAGLKATLLQEVWGEGAKRELPVRELVIPEEVRTAMEDRLILAEDIQRVIAYGEASGNRLQDRDSGCTIVYYRPNRVTYWVWYTMADKAYHVHKVYSHRIEILEDGEVRP